MEITHNLTTVILSVVMEWFYLLRSVMTTTLTISMVVTARVLRKMAGPVMAQNHLTALESVETQGKWLMKGATMETRTMAVAVSLIAQLL